MFLVPGNISLPASACAKSVSGMSTVTGLQYRPLPPLLSQHLPAFIENVEVCALFNENTGTVPLALRRDVKSLNIKRNSFLEEFKHLGEGMVEGCEGGVIGRPVDVGAGLKERQDQVGEAALAGRVQGSVAVEIHLRMGGGEEVRR